MTLNPNGTRRDVSGLEMESQVQEVLRLMDLYSIQDRVLPDDPADRGVEAGDRQRRLAGAAVPAEPPEGVAGFPARRVRAGPPHAHQGGERQQHGGRVHLGAHPGLFRAAPRGARDGGAGLV